MANNLRRPPNAQVTASEQTLKDTPADKPAWKAGMGQTQTTSSQSPLRREPSPVAQFGANPGMGTVQSTATQCTLSRTPNPPYEPTSKTTPRSPIKK